MKGPVWVTNNRRRIPLEQLSTDHILNILFALHRIPREECSGFNKHEWRAILVAELTRRNRAQK